MISVLKRKAQLKKVKKATKVESIINYEVSISNNSNFSQ